jgi:(4S)-4-hydroxy-5-phosphonooxypentane-2,3-dione isomerase
MFTVLVKLTVRPDHIEEFLEGIHVNARASLRDEPGCLRFDVHRSTDDPHHFVLYEIYTDEEAFRVAHRQAPHYAAWRDVASRCVAPGGHVNTFAAPVFPDDIPENPDPFQSNPPGLPR